MAAGDEKSRPREAVGRDMMNYSKDTYIFFSFSFSEGKKGVEWRTREIVLAQLDFWMVSNSIDAAANRWRWGHPTTTKKRASRQSHPALKTESQIGWRQARGIASRFSISPTTQRNPNLNGLNWRKKKPVAVEVARRIIQWTRFQTSAPFCRCAPRD